ncbi:MAG TPA: class I SAM-dependent methyltransferase [Thermoanaerobaculia bacterium]|nr:class I SAM-dependent methyltransferase [Thermoanaerobaculia bacterium]
MKTSITNRIRSVIDALPRPIRDSRWFMGPFFFVWFKGRHVRTAMEFKDLAPSMSDAEFADAYRRIHTFADNRVTDTNAEAMAYVLSRLEEGTLLDVGSGRGYFLTKTSGIGCDLLGGNVRAVAERLPFRNKSFDVVTCFHTLEHTRDLPRAIAELRRVARKQLIVIVPRQRRFHYTLDLHLNFFETPDALAQAMGAPGEIRQFGSDLVYISAP